MLAVSVAAQKGKLRAKQTCCAMTVLEVCLCADDYKRVAKTNMLLQTYYKTIHMHLLTHC